MNFSYIIPGIVAGMGLPGRYDSVDDDMAFLREQGIGAVLTLTEDPLPEISIHRAGLLYLHLPVRDFTAPNIRQIIRSVEFIGANSEKNIATAVHCYAGVGRTGTILACYLVSRGCGAMEAIRQIRKLRPGSIQGMEQENAVFMFERLEQE